MNAKQQATNEIRAFARSVKGILALADELEKVGSLEAAAKEAQVRFERIRGEEESASLSLAAALKDRDAAKVKASEILADARKLADKTVELSKASADEIVTKGKADAERLVQDAQRLKGDVDKLAQRRKEEVEVLDKAIASRTEKLQAIDKQMAEIRSKVS